MLAVERQTNAFNEAMESGNLARVVSSAFVLREAQFNANQYVEAIETLEATFSYLGNNDPSEFLIEAGGAFEEYENLCFLYAEYLMEALGNFSEAIKFSEKALRIANRDDFQTGTSVKEKAGAELNRAWILLLYGDAKRALSHLEKAMCYTEEENIIRVLGLVIFYKGHAYYTLGEFEKAAKYLENNMKEMIANKPTGFFTALYGLLAEIHHYAGDSQKAIKIFKKTTIKTWFGQSCGLQ